MQWFQRKSRLNGHKSQGRCIVNGKTDGRTENRMPILHTAKAGVTKIQSTLVKTYHINIIIIHPVGIAFYDRGCYLEPV